MKSNCWLQISTVLLLLFLTIHTLPAQTATPAAPTYEDLLMQGNNLMKGGDLHGAANTAAEAIKLDSNRFEAFVLAALIRYQQNNQVQAQRFLTKAYALAPADKKAALDKVAAIINSAPVQKTTPAAKAPAPTPAPMEDHEMVHQREILKLILGDADANSGSARKQFLGEFLTNSAAYVTRYPNDTNIWMLRAVTAAELDDRQAGWEAGQKMKAMGLADSDNPAIIKVMAALDRKGWLKDIVPISLNGTWEGTVDYTATEKRFFGTVNYHQIQTWRVILDQTNHELTVILLDYDKAADDLDNHSDVLAASHYLANGCIEPKSATGHGYKYHNVISFVGDTVTWNFNCDKGNDTYSSVKFFLPGQFKISEDGVSATFTELVGPNFDIAYKANGMFKRVQNTDESDKVDQNLIDL